MAETVISPKLDPAAFQEMTPADQAALARAVDLLEHASFAVRLSRFAGKQMSVIAHFAPAKISAVAARASGRALKGAMRIALASLNEDAPHHQRKMHRALAAVSGAAGGALGLASLPFELPISTLVMLRAIAAIAQAEGEDPKDPETALQCLQVFALSATDYKDPNALFESGYFALRALMARTISEAAVYLAQKTVIDQSAPIILRLISQIAQKFGILVTQKAMAQATPILGAAGGAAVNLAFIQHFQGVAKGHFTVRRLERRYSPPLVQREYEKILAERTLQSKVSAA